MRPPHRHDIALHIRQTYPRHLVDADKHPESATRMAPSCGCCLSPAMISRVPHNRTSPHLLRSSGLIKKGTRLAVTASGSVPSLTRALEQRFVGYSLSLLSAMRYCDSRRTYPADVLHHFVLRVPSRLHRRTLIILVPCLKPAPLSRSSLLWPSSCAWQPSPTRCESPAFPPLLVTSRCRLGRSRPT